MEIAGGETKQWFFECCSNLACVSVLNCFGRVQLCNSVDCNPPGFSVHGILQARILEWVTMASPGDLPNQGIEPESLVSLTLAGVLYHKCQLENLIPYSQPNGQRQSYG